MSDEFQTRETRARAAALLRAGRAAEAADAYRALAAGGAATADDWFNLGWSARTARDFAAALAAYDEALARGVARPEEVHVNRAAILSEELDDVPAATIELQRAVALAPGFTLAWLNLGNVHEDVGASEAARDAYENALRASPGNGRALARLTALDLHDGDAQGRIEPLRAALRRPALDPDEAAELLFALGAALDADARYDAAFAAFAEANRRVRDRLGHAGRYDAAAHERLVDALVAAPPLPPAPTNTSAVQPIFLCGLFRSGSTLAEQMLARHSRVRAGGEIDALPRLVAQRLGGDPARLGDLTAADVALLRADYLAAAGRGHGSAAMVTDKRSDNFLYLGLIRAMFPTAPIVHTRRDPIDNLLSIHFLYFADAVRYGSALEDSAHWYRQYRRLMRHWDDRFGDAIVDLSYDDLVADPDRVLGEVQDFCGLPREPLARAAPDAAPIRTASAWQVRRPLHARSSGRWRNYPAATAHIRRLIAE